MKKNNDKKNTAPKSPRLVIGEEPKENLKAGVPSYVHGQTFGDTCWGVVAWILN